MCNRRASSSRPPRTTSRSSGPKQDRPQSSSAETWCALFLPPVLHSLSLTASFLCLSRPTLRVQIAESGECLWELSLATHPGLEQRISPPRDRSASAKPFSELSGAHRKLVLPQEPNIPIPDRVARGRSPMRSAYVAQPERLIAAQDEKVLMARLREEPRGERSARRNSVAVDETKAAKGSDGIVSGTPSGRSDRTSSGATALEQLAVPVRSLVPLHLHGHLPESDSVSAGPRGPPGALSAPGWRRQRPTPVLPSPHRDA